MARKTKQKLSRERRGKLKRHLGLLLRVNAEPSAIRQTLSKKYGITTNTVDWYLKKAKENGKAKPQGSKVQRRASHRAPRGPEFASSNNRKSISIKAAAHSLSKAELEKALKIRQMLPKLEAALWKESQANSNLKVASRKVNNLRKVIGKLST